MIKVLFIALFISIGVHAQAPGSEVIDVRFIRDTYDKYEYGGASLVNSNPELFATFNFVRPFQSIRHLSKYHDRILFDQTYEIGEFGFRNIEKALYSSTANKHLIVAGDSNTFGIGVSDRETLPVLLANIKKEYHPYNFGIRGGAPHCTLGMMEFFPWNKIIAEEDGYFIYNYYDFLIDRVVGSKGYMAWNDGNSPNYQLNDNGEAEYIGSFRDRFINIIYKQILSVKWLDKLLPQLPRHRKHHSILVSKIFLKMKEEYLKKFPKGKFIVAINYSFEEMVPGRLEEIREELQKNKIAYVILPKLEFTANFKMGDGHLSAEGHKTEASLISKIISL